MSLGYRLLKRLSLGGAVLALVACAQFTGTLGEADGREQVLLKTLPTPEFLSEPQTLWRQGQMASLHLNAAGRIAFTLGTKTQLLDEGAPVLGGKYLTLRQRGDTLYALWWSHTNAKALYFRSSVDGGKTFAPVQIVNTADGVLPPYELAVDDSGALGVVYADERVPGYQIYFNRAEAPGLKWQEKDVRLDNAQPVAGFSGGAKTQATEPHLARVGRNLVATWQEVVNENKAVAYRVVSRMSPDLGKTWEKEIEVYRGNRVPSALHLVTVGDQVVLVGDVSQRGVQAWRTKDAGRSWQALGALARSEVFVNSQLALAAGGGRVYAVYTAEQADKKAQIQGGVLDLAKGKWLTAAQRLDPKALERTKSASPQVAALPGGGAVVVWQDFRYIRPTVYLSQTRNGEDWAPARRVMEDAGRFGLITPRVAVLGDQVLVSYERFVDDVAAQTDHALVALKYDAKSGEVLVPAYPPAFSEERKKAILKDRVESFWDARVRGDFSGTYGYFDPAFRAANPPEAFDKFQGNLRFHTFALDKLDIQENIARVTVKANFEVLETEVLGRKFSQPRTDTVMTNEWVWVYDNWFMVHQTALGNRALEY